MQSGPAPKKLTVAWYEEDDFPAICELGQWPGLATSYETWRSRATADLLQAAAAGYTVEIVTIRPDDYLCWLGDRENSAEARRQYVASIASGHGSD